MQQSILAAALLVTCSVFAQKTTPILLVNVSGPGATASFVRPVSLNGTGAMSPYGSAAVSFTGTQEFPSGLTQGTLTFFLNRADSFTVTAAPQPVGKVTNLNLPGPITGGTGAFSGATGSVNYTFTFTANTSSSGNFTLSGAGNITVGKTATAITLAGFNGTGFVGNAASGTLQTSSGSVTPFGNVTVNFSGIGNQHGATGLIDGALTFAFTGGDSFIASFSFMFDFNESSISLPCTITGGTGAFLGASGSLMANFTTNPDGTFSLTGAGSITQPPPGTPIITSVGTAYGSATIGQNTWLEIHGMNLAAANTPKGGVFWSNAPDFAVGRMPTKLNNMSVTVNGKPAFIWWFCSAVTTAACANDQINVLSPLDDTVGLVQVVVTSGATSSGPFSADMQTISPSFLVLDAPGHVTAQHANYTLLAPANLYPGTSTPALAGEEILVYAIGMGLPANALVNGSSMQTGPIRPLPVCGVGMLPATVADANVVSPGLYQLNLVVPSGAPSGDNLVSCTYGGAYTPPGALIAVK
jgi:uncharacterized protein (TIGR03437 family)